MPKLYDGWFNDQIAKQASTAVSKAIAAGKKEIEVNFPAVPNLDEVGGINWASCCRSFSLGMCSTVKTHNKFLAFTMAGQIRNAFEPKVWNECGR